MRERIGILEEGKGIDNFTAINRAARAVHRNYDGKSSRCSDAELYSAYIQERKKYN